jgi:ribonuclease HI / DNA polymerase III subunit epsilon
MSSQTYEIYTDGSCLGNKGNDPGGWAFIYIEGDKEFHISGGEKFTTNNKMELTAVIEALEFCPKNDLTIYSDSQYVIKGITEWIKNWKKKGWGKIKNREYWERLDKLCQGKNITWKWVKAHNGDIYNEMVDKLARKEAEMFRN